MGLKKLGFGIFRYLTMTKLGKKPFYTLLSHVELSNLVFWEADRLFFDKYM